MAITQEAVRGTPNESLYYKLLRSFSPGENTLPIVPGVMNVSGPTSGNLSSIMQKLLGKGEQKFPTYTERDLEVISAVEDLLKLGKTKQLSPKNKNLLKDLPKTIKDDYEISDQAAEAVQKMIRKFFLQRNLGKVGRALAPALPSGRSTEITSVYNLLPELIRKMNSNNASN